MDIYHYMRVRIIRALAPGVCALFENRVFEPGIGECLIRPLTDGSHGGSSPSEEGGNRSEKNEGQAQCPFGQSEPLSVLPPMSMYDAAWPPPTPFRSV